MSVCSAVAAAAYTAVTSAYSAFWARSWAPVAPSVGATEPGVGTVTFTGVGFSHDDVAVWLESLAKQKGYTNPYFTNSTKALIGTRSTVNFSSTVTMTSAALSGRYTTPAGG